MAAKLINLENKIYTLNTSGLRTNRPEYIVLHSTRLYPTFQDILKYHKSKGWAGLGYHLFTSDSGRVYQARPFDKEGAHALGFNTNSIGVCFHTSDGNLDKEKIQIGRNLIQFLNEKHPGIKLIPHTLAQVMYLNRLLNEFGIKKQFPESPKIVNEDVFQKIKSDIDSLVGTLDTSKYSRLKQRLKGFKNCSEGLLNYFV